MQSDHAIWSSIIPTEGRGAPTATVRVRLEGKEGHVVNGVRFKVVCLTRAIGLASVLADVVDMPRTTGSM